MSRRAFLKRSLAGAVWVSQVASAAGLVQEHGTKVSNATADPLRPWYRRTLRWGQTNLTEADPEKLDLGWWREYWRRTRIQGVIINAAGIVAYYPSKYPLQYRASTLGQRDLYGDLAKAAHEDGLAVLARMDSNRVHEDFFEAHSGWMARDADGHPYRAGDLYITCINSPYYDEWIPDILKEIIARSHPEGITDNSWSGLGRSSICYCNYCVRKFRERTGKAIPAEHNWEDAVYRAWITWNYARRLEVWDANNQVTRQAGGPACLWIGMNSASVSSQSQTFRDLKELCRRAEILMLDHQARSDAGGFQENGEAGALLHGLLGWDKLIPESMAMYQAGRPTFRKASKPEPEARLWALEGFAGTIQPWWHHVGAVQEDRRQFHTIEALNRWHERHEQYLVDRQPVASVGVLWSQQNTDFYGREHPDELVELPFRGVINALIRARIPYLPVHADHIERESSGLRLLILPNLAAISDGQLAAVRRFTEDGGGLLVTGESALFDEWGSPRAEWPLGELTGAHWPPGRKTLTTSQRVKRASETQHTYLRLPANVQQRHRVLRGFEETEILPFGGSLDELRISGGAVVPLTFVPNFPVYPPETSWMRTPQTSVPGLVLNTLPNGAPIAYLPADIDRRFARDNLPDQGDLLANVIRWTAREQVPLKVEGHGLIDCHLYRQPGRLILHLVNLTNAGTWRQPVDELIAVGPLRVAVRLPEGHKSARIELLVSERSLNVKATEGWARFELKSVLDHEVAVLGLS